MQTSPTISVAKTKAVEAPVIDRFIRWLFRLEPATSPATDEGNAHDTALTAVNRAADYNAAAILCLQNTARETLLLYYAAMTKLREHDPEAYEAIKADGDIKLRRMAAKLIEISMSSPGDLARIGREMRLDYSILFKGDPT